MNTTQNYNGREKSAVRVAAERAGVSAPIGVAISAVCGLIFSTIFSADGAFTMSPIALERFGTENMAFLNMLIAGAFIGGTFGAGSIFFDLTDWSMSKSFAANFLTTIPVLFFFIWFEGWYGNDQDNLVSAVIAALTIYLVTYIITFTIGRQKIKKVNTQL